MPELTACQSRVTRRLTEKVVPEGVSEEDRLAVLEFDYSQQPVPLPPTPARPPPPSEGFLPVREGAEVSEEVRLAMLEDQLAMLAPQTEQEQLQTEQEQLQRAPVRKGEGVTDTLASALARLRSRIEGSRVADSDSDDDDNSDDSF